MIRIITGIVVGIASTSIAQTYAWRDSSNTDTRWSNAANWADGVAPVSSTASFVEIGDTGFGYNYEANNDFASLDVGTITLAGRYVRGNAVRVHREVRVPFPTFGAYQLPLELIGDVTFSSSAPLPVAGGLAQVPTLRNVTGAANATIRGAWRIDQLEISGDVYVASDGSLSDYSEVHSFRSLRVDGLIDIPGTLSVTGGGPIDFSRGTLDLGRNDSTLGSSVAARLQVQGDLKLGKWFIGGMSTGPNHLYSDRVDVSGTLDLSNIDVLDGASVDYFSVLPVVPPPYVVLATYGNRIGSLDITSILVAGSFSPNVFGTFPIVYTSGENAGPGEIRVLLPEPSVFVTVAAGTLLVRRRREQ